MGITLVLRGDDHLANTPRQLLLLEALGHARAALRPPAALLAPGGSPLSKREGAASLTRPARAGLPAGARSAITCCGSGIPAAATPARNGPACRALRPGAHQSLGRTLRRGAVAALAARSGHACQPEAVERWLGARLDALGPGAGAREHSSRRCSGNVLFPSDADELVAVVTSDQCHRVARGRCADRRCRSRRSSPRRAHLFGAGAGDFKAWTRAVAAATGSQGRRSSSCRCVRH